VKDGKATGPIIPVNLTLFAAMAGTKLAPSLKGSILVVEDTGEKPRCVDRMLAQLELHGILREIAALAFADFKDCEPEGQLDEVIENYAAKVAGPVLRGVPFGHLIPTLAFRMGEDAAIEDGKLFLRRL